SDRDRRARAPVGSVDVDALDLVEEAVKARTSEDADRRFAHEPNLRGGGRTRAYRSRNNPARASCLGVDQGSEQGWRGCGSAHPREVADHVPIGSHTSGMRSRRIAIGARPKEATNKMDAEKLDDG